jgi:hypothetical protein
MSTLLISSSFAQTAVNFNTVDCNGVNHELFKVLDSGKVVVIAWVMPCATCKTPALVAYSEVQNYTSSHPDKIQYYLVDDYANTGCATLTDWAVTNGIAAPTAIFSSADIKMSDYNTPGMPKVVILCGSSHFVMFNENNALNVSNFNKALSDAITCSAPTSVNAFYNSPEQIQLFPNPVVGNQMMISYTLHNSSNVILDIYDVFGNRVKSIIQQQTRGLHKVQIDHSNLAAGVYYVSSTIGQVKSQSRFVVVR